MTSAMTSALIMGTGITAGAMTGPLLGIGGILLADSRARASGWMFCICAAVALTVSVLALIGSGL